MKIYSFFGLNHFCFHLGENLQTVKAKGDKLVSCINCWQWFKIPVSSSFLFFLLLLLLSLLLFAFQMQNWSQLSLYQGQTDFPCSVTSLQYDLTGCGGQITQRLGEMFCVIMKSFGKHDIQTFYS